MPVAPQSPPASNSTADTTRSAIAAIWRRNLPQTLDRLTLLDQTATAALTQDLTSTLAAEARDTAHKLAGSLGTFGYPEGTRLARDLEQLLDNPIPNATRIREVTVALRASIFPPNPPQL